jgi:hypothetical protein
MNREDIVRMAREVWGDDSAKPWHESALTHLEAFANLVAAAEREACAQIAFNAKTYIQAAHEIRERGAP